MKRVAQMVRRGGDEKGKGSSRWRREEARAPASEMTFFRLRVRAQWLLVRCTLLPMHALVFAHTQSAFTCACICVPICSSLAV